MQRQFVTIEENASVAFAVQELQSQKLESVIVTRQGLAIGMVSTGLSTGITSLSLDSFSKLMLTANMILGSFEIIAVLYIFFSALRK